MKNYIEYQVEEFIQDRYFRNWVLERLSPEDRFWNNWQAEHPEKQDTVEMARSLVIAFQCEDLPMDQVDINEAVKQILTETQHRQIVPFYKKKWLAVAAMFVVVLAVGFGIYNKQVSIQKDTISEVVIPLTDVVKGSLSDTSATRTLLLSDGTEVTLAPNSNLRIGQEFGVNNRKVYLKGEAFFNVAKNGQKPFFVYTGKVVTKVIGTSFKIMAYEYQANVSIAVRTGKVTVFKSKSGKSDKESLSDEIILTPNQQAVYIKADQRLIKTLVENPAVLSRSIGNFKFEFDEVPVSEVLATLEKAYGVKISYDNDLLQDFKLKAMLTNESLYEKLDLICETIHARYEIVDGQIILYGK